MDLTPNDITNFSFSSKMRGYDKDEVENLLSQVATALEKAKNENARLATESQSLKNQVETLKQFEDAIKKAAIDARKNADEMMAKAKAEADQIINAAKADALKITEAKEQAVIDLNDQIQKLEETKKSFIHELRNLINSHMDMVDDVAVGDVKKTLSDSGFVAVGVAPEPAAKPTTLEVPSKEKSLSDSDSFQVTDSADVTREDMESFASDEDEEVEDSAQEEEEESEMIPPTRLSAVDEDDTPVDTELSKAIDQFQQKQHEEASQQSDPEIIDPNDSAPVRQSSEEDPFGFNDITQIKREQELAEAKAEAQAKAQEQPQAQPQQQQQEQPQTIKEHLADNNSEVHKPGEFFETDRSAEDIPDEFIPVREKTEIHSNGPNPIQNIVPDDIAIELDNVVAKFEEEMDKAEKN